MLLSVCLCMLASVHPSEVLVRSTYTTGWNLMKLYHNTWPNALLEHVPLNCYGPWIKASSRGIHHILWQGLVLENIYECCVNVLTCRTPVNIWKNLFYAHQIWQSLVFHSLNVFFFKLHVWKILEVNRINMNVVENFSHQL